MFRSSVALLEYGGSRKFHLLANMGLSLSEIARSNQPELFYSHALKRFSTGSSYPPHFLLGMPAMSPLMTEGRLLQWKHKVGDQVDTFDVICDVETASLTEREDETCVMEVICAGATYLNNYNLNK